MMTEDVYSNSNPAVPGELTESRAQGRMIFYCERACLAAG